MQVFSCLLQFLCDANVNLSIKNGYKEIFWVIAKNAIIIKTNEERLYLHWKIKKQDEILSEKNQFKDINC